MSDLEISDVVNEILENLGLQNCADTLIGGGILMAGGLSGGEKKRVQCGVELVTKPEIIVLDEPTSGLDSYSAQNLMEVLKKIANAGATVIVTIHQPPPPVVRKIDNLLLLLAGRLLYTGAMGNVLEQKFTDFGYPRPNDYNIADWILVCVVLFINNCTSCDAHFVLFSFIEPSTHTLSIFLYLLLLLSFNSKLLKPILSKNWKKLDFLTT